MGGLGPAPAVAFLAVDAGAFAALGVQDARVAGVGVAPAQVSLQPRVNTTWLEWFELLSTNSRSCPKCASIGFAHEL